MTSTDHLRRYANLAPEVPESLLETHVASAEGDLRRSLTVEVPPPPAVSLWEEAVTVKALASLLPWLHTFALDGAAKVGRLEGTVEFRFLTPEDVAALVRAQLTRFGELVAAIRPFLPAPEAGVVIPGLSMSAV